LIAFRATVATVVVPPRVTSTRREEDAWEDALAALGAEHATLEALEDGEALRQMFAPRAR
jgi:hypothetical protein